MPLTNAQKLLVKAEITADPALNNEPNTPDGNFAIALALNAQAVPDYYVWRTDVPTSDVKKAIVWTEYNGQSVSNQNAFALMISNGIINASQVNVRQGIQDIFSGPQQAGTRNALTEIAKRTARRIEKVLATGTGTQASPATMGYEGTISYQDVEASRNAV